MNKSKNILVGVIVAGALVMQGILSNAQLCASDKTISSETVRPFQIYFKTTSIVGLRLFYLEANDSSKPAIVLLHGFPSSTYQFHDLIRHLGDWFHVIAPDPNILKPTFDDVTF